MGAHGVDDDVLAIGLVGPLSNNFEQGLRFDGDEDIAQKIVRGYAIGQVQEGAGEDLRQREANFAHPTAFTAARLSEGRSWTVERENPFSISPKAGVVQKSTNP